MHVHIIDNDHFVMLFSNNGVSLVCAISLAAQTLPYTVIWVVSSPGIKCLLGFIDL